LLIRPLESAPPSSATAGEGVAVAVVGDERAATVQAVAPPTRSQVEAAVEAANASLAAMNRSIEFQVDPDTRQIVVRLIDTQSNQVLRQIPSQEMLEIAKSIDHLQGVLLRNRA
jgi:flagellar protein FlaG